MNRHAGADRRSRSPRPGVIGALARMLEPDVGRHLMRGHDEVIVDEIRRHWFVFVRPTFEAWIAIAALGFGASTQMDVVVLLALGLLAHACWVIVRERRETFVVTNLRVFRLTGVLSTKRASMPLTRILDTTVDKPLHGRLLGFGHLIFESAAQEQGLRDIKYVGGADRREHLIQETVADVVHGPRLAARRG
jgi:uncharacterized membrane protein YdbT with pleckstrin-like domain